MAVLPARRPRGQGCPVQETVRRKMGRRGGTIVLVALVACSSTKLPMGGGGVEAPPPQASAGSVDGGADASVDGGADAPARKGDNVCNMADCWVHIPGPTELLEEDFRRCLSPLEKTLIETCPERPWSTNVPDQPCTKDSECGDGFCNRGNCQAIYTCDGSAGIPCKDSKYCYGICIDGRCRSCISDEECQDKNAAIHPRRAHVEPWICHPEYIHGGYGCGSKPLAPPPP